LEKRGKTRVRPECPGFAHYVRLSIILDELGLDLEWLLGRNFIFDFACSLWSLTAGNLEV
jgi:hypothetical protein